MNNTDVASPGAIDSPRMDWSRPIDAEGAARIDRFVAAVHAGADQEDERSWQMHRESMERYPDRQPSPPRLALRITPDEAAALKAAVGVWPLSDGLRMGLIERTGLFERGGASWRIGEALVAYATEPGVSVVDVVRLHHMLMYPYESAIPKFPWNLAMAFEAMYAQGTVRSLMDIWPACNDAGIRGELIVRSLVMENLWSKFARDWPDIAVVPFLQTQSEAFATLVFQTSDELHMRRTALVTLMYRIPEFDAQLRAVADELCFVAPQILLDHAQDLRATRPGALDLALAFLAHAQPERRLMAARWLGRLRDQGAVDPLHTALATESGAMQRAAMLDALVATGASIDRYIDRDALAADAKRGLARGVPKDMAFFRFEGLPVVRWADSGAEVPTDSLRWLMVLALKRKKAEPDAAMRLFCQQFDPAGRAAFARFVMEGWIAEDTRTPSHDDALAWAERYQAQRLAQHPQADKETQASWHRAAYQAMRRKLPEHTAASKGLFAVVGACADGSIAVPLARYMKRYHRPRKNIMPHLLVVLAQVAEAPALQLLLSIGTQTGAPRIQAKAAELANALAERQGWTVEELADRSVPTVGFDELGHQELSYGPRHVAVTLHPDLSLTLASSEGKPLKAMPNARVDDDAELVKEAKRTLKVTREMLAQVATLQTARLRATAWIGRGWSFEAWDALIHRHTVLRHIARRIVWMGAESDGAAIAFRPLGDGTLTDTDDAAVTFTPSARITVATDAALGEQGVAAWLAHLADYEVESAWPQLDQPRHTPRADQADRYLLDDFTGHMVGAWALRSRVSALGYRRLANFGHDTTATFHRLLAGTGLIVEVRATDHGFDDGDVEVALVSMRVYRHDERGRPVTALDVHAMAPALYSHCYEDFRAMAADGTGYREDWRKVTWMENP